MDDCSAGGLVGNFLSGTITNCYATGNVSASSNQVPSAGGLIGRFYQGSITNCYATGNISSSQTAGGLVGYIVSDDSANNCYRLSTQTVEGVRITSSGTPLTDSEKKIQSSFTGWDFNTVWAYRSGVNNGYPILMSTAGTAPKIITESLPDGGRGNLYNQTLTATGDAKITWVVSKDSLPSGLTLNENTGVISGMPTSLGTFNFTIKAINGAGTDEKIFTVIIKEPEPASVTGVSVYPANVTVAAGGSATLTATVYPFDAQNKAVAWFSDNVNVATVNNGVVKGVSQGIATITVITIDGGYIAACTVTVTEPRIPPEITTSDLPNGTSGTTYSQTLTATGGAPFTWSIAGGSLPSGLTLTPQTGVISGMPNANGTFNFTVRVSNGMNPDATKSFSITIAIAGEPWDDYPDDPLYHY